MVGRSLDEFHNDIIDKVLYFVPSIVQLLQFEVTSCRFRSLTLDHMKLMTTVDMRTPKLTKGQVSQMDEMICKRFSRKLTRVIVNLGHFPGLREYHPQLFISPLEIADEPTVLAEGRQRSAKLLSEFLDRDSCSLFNGSLVFARPQRVCFIPTYVQPFLDFVKDGKNKDIIIQELASVRELRMHLFRMERELFEKMADTAAVFGNLKRMVVIVENPYVVDLDQARIFKEFTAKFEHQMILGLYADTIFQGPVQDILEVIGSYVNTLYYPVRSEMNSSQLLSLTKLDVLFVCCEDSDSSVFDHIPASVTYLALRLLGSNLVDSATRFLQAHGGQLSQLSISYQLSLTQSQVERLLDAIAGSCVNLNYLKLGIFWSSLSPVNNLCHLLRNLSANLSGLTIMCHTADIRSLETVVSRFTKLKHLNLILAEDNAGDLLDIWAKFETMTKLESARIHIGGAKSLGIAVTYLNHQLVVHPNQAARLRRFMAIGKGNSSHIA